MERYDVCIEGADLKLKRMSLKAAAFSVMGQSIGHERARRIEKELNRIELFGYAPMFLILHDLINDNDIETYEVISNGLAGSYIAYLLNISKANPLDKACPLYDETCMGITGENRPSFELRLSSRAYSTVKGSIPKLPGIAEVYDSDNNVLKGPDDNITSPVLFLVPDYCDKKPDEFKDRFKQLSRITIVNSKWCDQLVEDVENYGYYPTDVQVKDPEILKQVFECLKSGDQKGKDLRELIDADTEEFLKIINVCDPKSYTDYIKILCLCHGTGVWEGNAKEQIMKKHKPLSEILACTEDVYEKLMEYSINRETAFMMADAVHRGKFLDNNGRYPRILSERGISSDFIESCAKAKYMFSRAHCANLAYYQLRLLYYRIIM